MINYFNYFTEIEEHFQRARGTSLFLLSPLDWALIESWKNSGVPIEAVLRGIDAAFENWRGRRIKTQQINGLAFCSQAVLAEAERSPENPASRHVEAPFPEEQVKAYLAANAVQLAQNPRPEFHEIAATLTALAQTASSDFEALEQTLSTLEQKLIALARAAESDEAALETRRQLDAQLRPYRGKMTAPQLAMLEQQYRERSLLEKNGLPRLSLFYLR